MPKDPGPSAATKIAYEGSKFRIELLVGPGGKCDVDEFLTALDPASRRRVDSLFELMAEKGSISNKEKFKKLEGSNGVFEFKSFQIRLLCFFAGAGRLVICRGLKKKRDKHGRQDIEFAERCRSVFLEPGT